MAFKLNKKEEQEWQALLFQASVALDKLNHEIEEFNAAMERLRGDVEGPLEAYNQALNNLKEFADARAQEWRDAKDERSERWQESEAAESAEELIGEWENLELNEVEIDWPEDVELIDSDPIDTAEGVPVSVDSW